MAAASATHSSFLQLQKYNAPEWASSLKLVVRDMTGNGMKAAVAAAEAEAQNPLAVHSAIYQELLIVLQDNPSVLCALS
jgi:hypothetical protein